MKRTIVTTGKTPEQKKKAVVAMYTAIHGTEPDAEQLKSLDERLMSKDESVPDQAPGVEE